MATATRTRKKVSTKTAEKRGEELAQLKSLFDEKVSQLCESSQWREMLTAMTKFHHYSFQNMLLIWLQNPEATRCAGYTTWKQLGYQVRKGEKGLRIYAPYRYTVKDENGDVKTDSEGNEMKRTGFRVTSTFDRSQVDATDKAKPLGEDVAPKLQGEDNHGIILALGDALRAQGWEVAFEPISSSANGYTRPSEKKIVVDSENPAAQQAKTLIHEAAHALLHTELAPVEYVEHRGVCETEAESVAFVVAGALGWDTSDYSVGYVAGWSDGDKELLRSTAENVLKTSHSILEMLKENPR